MIKPPTTPAEWWGNLEAVKENIRDIVDQWHPRSGTIPRRRPAVTAPNAERAAEVVREQIRKEEGGSPLEEFDKALESRDHTTLLRLLNEAWFGFPESRPWPPGFGVLCDLCSESWVFQEE